MCKRLIIIAGFAVFAIGAFYLLACRAPSGPSASLYLLGYQFRQDSVVATIILTNTGTSPLSYWDTSEGVEYKIQAQVRGLATNWSSGGGPSSMAGPKVVWPSRSVRIYAILPAGAATWRCALPVQGTGARVGMFTRLGQWGIWNRTYHISQWFIGLFPMNDSHERQIQSDPLAISTNAVPR